MQHNERLKRYGLQGQGPNQHILTDGSIKVTVERKQESGYTLKYKLGMVRLSLFSIVILVGCLVLFLLHNVNNVNYPLSGEFFTSPFHGEILKRSLNVWDERFGLGFSNLLNSAGAAPYASVYSGAMGVSNNVLNALFQYAGASYFLNQVASLLLLVVGVHCILSDFRPNLRNITVVLLSVAITAIVHSADMFIDITLSGGRFVAAQGLMLIAFLHIRRLSRLRFRDIYSASNFISLSLILSTLLLVFSQYFLVLALMVGLQGTLEFAWNAGKRVRVVIDYAKLLAIFIALILVIYGYVVAPPILSAGSALLSGTVGRHDSPMAYSLINVLRFGNNPIHDSFGWAGVWLQFGLALLGIILAMFSSGMKRWAGIDLFVIIIFLFLSKGSATPFPEINHWLHVNIPFLRMMGSGYPYFGVIYTLLIYYLIFGICSSLGTIEKKLPRVGEYIGFALIVVVLAVSIFRNDDYLSGDFGGRIQSIEYPGEYYNFKKIAERDMQVGRSYYFPDEGAQIGLDYRFSPAHPLGCCFDLPFSSVFPININWSNFSNASYSGYYGQTMAFLMKHAQNGDDIARILSGADTKYAVFDMSLKQTSPASERMLAVRDQVRTSKSFEFRSALSNRYLEVYENKQWQLFSSETQSITLGTDDPSIFLMAAKAGTSLSKDSIVVSGAITLSEAMELKGNNNLSKILLYNSDERGLMLDMIRPQYEIKPDANFLSSDGQSWFTNNRGYQFQHTERYGGRFIGQYPIAAISDGARVSYRAKILPHIKNRLFVRALVSPNSGRVVIYVNGEKKLLNLRSSEYVGIQWFDLGDVISLTGKVDVEIESLEAGQAKAIDVVSLIPEKQLIESLEMMRNLFSGIQIDRVKKTDYLRWKQTKAADGLEKTATVLDDSQIKPKRITIARQHFKLHDDFDHFGDGAGGDSINLTEQEYAENVSLGPSAKDRNFLRTYNGIQHGFVASADTGAGGYSLKYELVACQPFSELTLNLSTAYVSVESPLTIDASDDASAWIRLAARTSDVEGGKALDLSEFARGKKKIYIKMSYEKLKEAPGSIYLMDLAIRGVAGTEDMNCESPPVVESKNESHFPRSKPDGGLLSPKVGGAGSLYGKPTGKSVIIINKAFDPNWRMDGAHPFSINYGFLAFVTDDAKPFHEPIHVWQDKYRILLFCSLGFYLFFWFAWIWNGCQRERHSVQ